MYYFEILKPERRRLFSFKTPSLRLIVRHIPSSSIKSLQNLPRLFIIIPSESKFDIFIKEIINNMF